VWDSATQVQSKVSNINFGIVRKCSRNMCCMGRCCLNTISLGGGKPMNINCVPLLVYLFSCRFRYADDDFVFNKTSDSNHLPLIYTQVYSKLNILLILRDLPCTYKWKTSDSYLITYWGRFNNCTFLLLNANILPLLLADDVHVFLSQLIPYSEVCSERVNTHLEIDDNQHESVISYDILVAMYCCYLRFTSYSD
jgi:hypothetical protein